MLTASRSRLGTADRTDEHASTIHQDDVSQPAVRVTQARKCTGNCTRHQNRRHGVVTSETVALLDTPLSDTGAAAAESRGVHDWSPQR